MTISSNSLKPVGTMHQITGMRGADMVRTIDEKLAVDLYRNITISAGVTETFPSSLTARLD